MSRLIDAEKLKDYIHSQNGRPVIGMTFGEMIGMFIDEQPTVEAKPVVHGEWLDLRESSKDIPRSECSECGRVIFGLESSYNFCPKCGADMRGGKNG